MLSVLFYYNVGWVLAESSQTLIFHFISFLSILHSVEGGKGRAEFDWYFFLTSTWSEDTIPFSLWLRVILNFQSSFHSKDWNQISLYCLAINETWTEPIYHQWIWNFVEKWIECQKQLLLKICKIQSFLISFSPPYQK